MNRNQVILLLAVLAVIGGAGLVLLQHNKESWSSPEGRLGEKVLPNFQINEMAAIHVKGDAELNLMRKGDVWRVQERGDYPANIHQLADLMLKLRDLKVVQAETIGPSQLGRVNLDEPGHGSTSGTLVEFKDAQGKVIDSLLLGKLHIREQNDSRPSPFAGVGSPDGRYILVPGNSADVLLVSNSLTLLEPRPEMWLSKDFFKLDRIKSIAVTPTNASNSWKISLETESSPWALADAKPGETLDAKKASRTTNTLAFPRFSDIALNTTPTETGLDKPLVVTIETFDHFTYTFKIGGQGPGGHRYTTIAVTADFPAEQVTGKELSENTKKLQEKLKQEQTLAGWVYLVDPWILNGLLRDRAQLLAGQN